MVRLTNDRNSCRNNPITNSRSSHRTLSFSVVMISLLSKLALFSLVALSAPISTMVSVNASDSEFGLAASSSPISSPGPLSEPFVTEPITSRRTHSLRRRVPIREPIADFEEEDLELVMGLLRQELRSLVKRTIQEKIMADPVFTVNSADQAEQAAGYYSGGVYHHGPRPGSSSYGDGVRSLSDREYQQRESRWEKAGERWGGHTGELAGGGYAASKGNYAGVPAGMSSGRKHGTTIGGWIAKDLSRWHNK